MKKTIFFFILLLFFFRVEAQESIPSADAVMREAYTQAAKEGKTVFVIFHASWCGWCHKMDSALNDQKIKKFFDDHYVIRHLTVLEFKNKTGLENPGAEAMFLKYAGSVNEGIPFWLLFDKNGTLLADSKVRADGRTTGEGGNNAGCPASASEVDYFISVLRKSSPLKESELELIRKRFRENEQH